METFTTLTDSIQDGIVESIRTSGDLAARAARKLREQTDRFVPNLPAAELLEHIPSPLELTEGAYTFTIRVLEAQREALSAFVAALSEEPSDS